MGVFDFVKSGVKEMMIARDDRLKGLIVYKHPDQNFPMFSQLTVDSDECAVFFKDGKVVGVMPPGGEPPLVLPVLEVERALVAVDGQLRPVGEVLIGVLVDDQVLQVVGPRDHHLAHAPLYEIHDSHTDSLLALSWPRGE